jgi:hypothetical protein
MLRFCVQTFSLIGQEIYKLRADIYLRPYVNTTHWANFQEAYSRSKTFRKEME